MAKTVITESTNDSDNLFVIDGREYKKGEYEFETIEDQDAAGNDRKLLGIKNKNLGFVVVSPKRPTDFNNGTSDYTDYDDAVAGISSVIF